MKTMLLIGTLLTTTAHAGTSFHEQSLWKKVKGAEAWTAITVQTSRAMRAQLEKAADLEEFCPGYAEASPARKDLCWLRLVGALAKFESSFHTSDSYRDPEGVTSVGLLSLAEGECAAAPKAEQLKDPVLNLECGVQKLAGLIEKDQRISGPEGQRGAALYWATFREPYRVGDYKFGHRDEVIQLIGFQK